MPITKLTRRSLLARLAAATASALLVACAPEAQSAAQPTASAPAPTVAQPALAPLPGATPAAPAVPPTAAAVPSATVVASLPANAPTTASPATIAAPAPPAPPPASPPAIAAKAATLLNADDGRILYSLNPDERLPMGSTTKMMTALIVVEDHVENHNDLNAKVTASQRAAALGATNGYSSIHLQEGESLTLEQMLYGMLLPSGDDAAVALAEYDAGSVVAFANKMNQMARELGLTNTHYTNPHGLDDPDHYTSALDNAKLGTEVMKHEEIRKIVDTYQYTIPGARGPRHLVNTNDLLRTVPYINGIKTGSTDAAGECIVVSANVNGVHLIFSYLGGPSLALRDRDVMNMLAYGFARYGVTTENGPQGNLRTGQRRMSSPGRAP